MYWNHALLYVHSVLCIPCLLGVNISDSMVFVVHYYHIRSPTQSNVLLCKQIYCENIDYPT